MADFEGFSTLRAVLENARWAGAPSQEEIRAEYLQLLIGEAVAQLGEDFEPLALALEEILKLQEEELADISECGW